MILLPKIIEKTIDSDFDIDSGHLFTKDAIQQFRTMYNMDVKSDVKNANKTNEMLTRIYIDRYENIIQAVDVTLKWVYDNSGDLAYGAMTVEPILVLPQLGDIKISLSLKTIKVTPDNKLFNDLLDKQLLVIPDDELNAAGGDIIASAPLDTYPDLITNCDIASTQLLSYVENILQEP